MFSTPVSRGCEREKETSGGISDKGVITKTTVSLRKLGCPYENWVFIRKLGHLYQTKVVLTIIKVFLRKLGCPLQN